MLAWSQQLTNIPEETGVRVSSYLSAPPPPLPRRLPPSPRRCCSEVRPPRTAGSPRPGCRWGAGRRRSWRPWTSGSWLSTGRQASSLLLATVRSDTLRQKQTDKTHPRLCNVAVHCNVELKLLYHEQVKRSLSGCWRCNAEWSISSTGVCRQPRTWVLMPTIFFF